MTLRVRGDEGASGAIGNLAGYRNQLAGNPFGPKLFKYLVENQVDNLFSPVKTKKM
jgi:hypothetical protein